MRARWHRPLPAERNPTTFSRMKARGLVLRMYYATCQPTLSRPWVSRSAFRRPAMEKGSHGNPATYKSTAGALEWSRRVMPPYRRPGGALAVV